MGWNGVGKLTEIKGKIDANQYVDILDNHLLPSMEESGIVEGGCIFQQDNDPEHTSKKAKNWIKENDITLLNWPAQSPDPNPIEHLWHHINCSCASMKHQPKVFGRFGREWQRCGMI